MFVVQHRIFVVPLPQRCIRSFSGVSMFQLLFSHASLSHQRVLRLPLLVPPHLFNLLRHCLLSLPRSHASVARSPLLFPAPPPAPLPAPTTSYRILRPPAPPHASLTPAVDIICNGKYVGARTGGDEVGWQTAGGSEPCVKCPRSPLAMVGGGIIRHLFWHLIQQ